VLLGREWSVSQAPFSNALVIASADGVSRAHLDPETGVLETAVRVVPPAGTSVTDDMLDEADWAFSESDVADTFEIAGFNRDASLPARVGDHVEITLIRSITRPSMLVALMRWLSSTLKCIDVR